MKIIPYSLAAAKHYSGKRAVGVAGRVVVGAADGARRFCMRIFEVAKDGMTARHSHEWEHEVFVHAGEGAVWKDGKWEPLSAGDVVFVPGNEEHQLKNTGDRDFVFVCVIPSGVPEL